MTHSTVPILLLRNLVKQYGDFVAVKGLNLQVEAGECFGLLGPNGAGKTSAIRMIHGFAPPTSGTLEVFGLEVTAHWRTIRSRLGVCQQDNTLDPDLSVVQNLLVFAGYFQIPSKVAQQRADALLTFFALEKKRAAKVAELSGGLARRLTLARALINNPELVILDEPTTGLDPQSRHLLWERMQMLRNQGKTLLLTTHYMEEAAQLCDRLVIMDHGQVLVEGRPQELITQHVGQAIIEIVRPSAALREFLATTQANYDDTEQRLILYANGDHQLEQTLRERFAQEQYTFRSPSLEDVFLKLTGRELREE